MSIPLVDALTGFNRTIGHFSERSVVVSVNGVVGCGQELRIAGEGMPRRVATDPRGRFGDLFVGFDIIFPKTLTPEQRSAVRASLVQDHPDGLPHAT